LLTGEKDRNRYPQEPPQLPQYDISPDLKKLTLVFIGAMLINFLIAGICAIGMRIIQADVSITKFGVDSIQQNVLFYSLLTSHGQVMFFGVLSMNTMWFGYYATSKWGRKPLSGMKLAKISFWVMEAAVVLIFLSPVSGFGAGWYNLMPLTFLPGTPTMSWGTTAAITFMAGDVLVGVAISIFCIVILLTLLRGKIPVGTQMYGARHGENAVPKEEQDLEEGEDPYSIQDLDHTHREDLPAEVRWVSLLGINGWFTKKWRDVTPAVPILLVASFVTAMIQIVANPGLFVQLAQGFMSIQNPIAASNKWNYRPWPFYFIFSVLVFSHHVFMDIPNPIWLQMVSQTASLGIIWPSSLTIFTALLFIWRSKISWNITTRFFYAGIAGWAFGGFQGAQLGLWGTDVYLHNTMAMPGHIHLMLLLGPLLMAFGVIYAIIPDLTKKHMSKNLGEIHFWLTIFGGFGLALLFSTIGAEGAIRREADMQAAFQWAMPWLLFFAICIGITQLVFVFNFVKTLRRKTTSAELEEYKRLHQEPTGMGITR
jgi:heme/copper-type cytochrome/quinol oxidase subunit 1